jgi:type VI secretion system secreted protein VgrG
MLERTHAHRSARVLNGIGSWAVGQSSVKLDQMGVTIKGMMIKIEGTIMVDVKGLMTTVKGDAMLTLQGGIVMIN